jgi:hypothetical protein
MANPRVTVLALLALGAVACASAPAKPPAAQPASEQRESAPATTPQEDNLPPPAAVSFTPSRKLGPGQCEECFDCVDTVGFPPPGMRWTCVQDKCVKAKLLGFSAEAAAANGATKSAEPQKSQAAPRKARKRRR